MTPTEIEKTLSEHARWLATCNSDCVEGRCANFCSANLHGANLHGANLHGAKLRGAGETP